MMSIPSFLPFALIGRTCRAVAVVPMLGGLVARMRTRTLARGACMLISIVILWLVMAVAC